MQGRPNEEAKKEREREREISSLLLCIGRNPTLCYCTETCNIKEHGKVQGESYTLPINILQQHSISAKPFSVFLSRPGAWTEFKDNQHAGKAFTEIKYIRRDVNNPDPELHGPCYCPARAFPLIALVPNIK